MELNKYLGLLKWSLNYTDGTRETKISEMDAERREWLKEAMEAGTVDPADQMKTLISVLKVERPKDGADASAHNEEDFVNNMVASLEHLQEWVESLDWAADLHKLGGFETVIKLCSDPAQRIRERALEVFATVVQNHPQCQDWALDLGALQPLVTSLRKPADELEQSKTMLALASLVRNHTKATVTFIKEHKGVALLLQLAAGGSGADIPIQGEPTAAVAHPKGRAKAVFLLRYLTDTVPAIRVQAAAPLVKALNACAVQSNPNLRDHALGLLKIMYEDPAAAPRIGEEERNATRTALEQLVPESASTFSPPLDEHSIELAAEVSKAMQSPCKQPQAPGLMLGDK